VPHDTKDREHFVGELHGVFSGSVRIALQWPRQGHQAASSVFNVEVVCLSTVMSTVQGVAPACLAPRRASPQTDVYLRRSGMDSTTGVCHLRGQHQTRSPLLHLTLSVRRPISLAHGQIVVTFK
jgi:hypothetical protein